MKKKILDLKNISFSYFNKKIIDDISLEIYEDEIISIIGCNGSGKTTLGKIISLLLEIDSGEIFFYGKKIDFDSIDIYNVRKNIGFIFQNPNNQFFGLTVRDDIAFGLENNLVSADDIEKKIKLVSEKMKIVDLLDKDVQHLSGGQKYKVTIADMLVLEPKIIIFDESFAMLDAINKKDILDLIKNIKNKYHITVIYITHNLEETLNSDKIIVLDKGKIFLSGSPIEVFTQKNKLNSINMDVPFIFKLNEKFKEESLIKEYHYDLDDLIKNICK